MGAYDDYLTAAAAYQAEHPEQRHGQAYYNALYQLHPEIAELVSADHWLDPFYVDYRIPALLGFVKSRLEAAT